MPKFFIVNAEGFIYPIDFKTLEEASASCETGEMVYMAESLEELEFCLTEWEDDFSR